jgi:uncharacterized protein (TIGR00251 family)
MISLTETAAGVSFAVKVQPRARKSAVTGVHDNALKIALNAPPLDGRANAALIGLLADLLQVSRSRISILTGEQSRQKVVRVSGMTTAEATLKLQPYALAESPGT